MNVHCLPNHGATNEWATPPEIIAELGPFDDDPCQPGSIEGFFRPWEGFVWLNPPYGRGITDWLQKMAGHNNGIALIFARTETRWFIDWVWNKASSLRFIHGRLYFLLNGEARKGNAGGPSVLVGYGPEADRRLENCNIAGSFIRLNK
jgi:hypothetical protein